MIKVGILGYGNLGRGVEAAVKKNEDMELVAVYTRRDPSTLTIKTPAAAVKSTADLDTGKEDIDILVICGGSATDLPEMTPKYAAMYNVIDSFDTHARVPEHFANVDKAAKAAGKIGIISCGWDPGMFSIRAKSAPSSATTKHSLVCFSRVERVGSAPLLTLSRA